MTSAHYTRLRGRVTYFRRRTPVALRKKLASSEIRIKPLLSTEMTRELMGRDVYARPDGVDPGEVIVPADSDGQGLPLFHADELDDIAIIGVIDDIVLDDAGQMQLIVVDKHGLVGIGGRTIAIDAAHTQFATTSRDDPTQILLLTDVSVEDAENAPDFEPGEVSDRIGTRERLKTEDIAD